LKRTFDYQSNDLRALEPSLDSRDGFE